MCSAGTAVQVVILHSSGMTAPELTPVVHCYSRTDSTFLSAQVKQQ